MHKHWVPSEWYIASNGPKYHLNPGKFFFQTIQIVSVFCYDNIRTELFACNLYFLIDFLPFLQFYEKINLFFVLLF